MKVIETTRSNGAEYHVLKMQIEYYIFGADNFRKATNEVLHIAHVADAEMLLMIENDKADKRRQEAELMRKLD